MCSFVCALFLLFYRQDINPIYQNIIDLHYGKYARKQK